LDWVSKHEPVSNSEAPWMIATPANTSRKSPWQRQQADRINVIRSTPAVRCKLQAPLICFPDLASGVSSYTDTPRHADASHLPRRVQVLAVQLRSGHCHCCAAYHNTVCPTSNPLCRRCNVEAPLVFEHWLQEYRRNKHTDSRNS